jgi:hypothetical protein
MDGILIGKVFVIFLGWSRVCNILGRMGNVLGFKDSVLMEYHNGVLGGIDIVM